MDNVTYNAPPHRFEAGTPPIAQAVGLGCGARLHRGGRAQGNCRVTRRNLTAYAHERLSAINSLRIIGTGARQRPDPFVHAWKEAHAHDVATLIDRAGVAVRAGTHCAMPLLQRFGVTSTCRASFGLYNTRAEIDAFWPTRWFESRHRLFV